MNRNRFLISLIGLAILPATPSLIAQESESAYRADIPFQFSVDNKTMPAGEYRIAHHGAFLLIGNDHSTVMTVANAGEPTRDGHNKLVFDRVSGSYFLRELATGSSDSMELATSKAEKKALASLKLAVATPPEQTTINLAGL